MSKSDSGHHELTEKIQLLEKLNAQKEGELTFQQRSFWALVTFGELVIDSISIPELLKIAADKIWDITGFNYVGMRLLFKERRAYKLIAQRGMSPEMEKDLVWLSEDMDYVAEVTSIKRPVVNPLKDSASLNLGYQNMVCVPLLGADQIVGLMELVTKEKNISNYEEIRWLSFTGRFIGLLILNKQISEELKNRAVITERTHLAQEIHDGLVQSLNSLYVWAEEASLSLGEGKMDAVNSAVANIKQIAIDANKALRDELIGLRGANVVNIKIIDALQDMVKSFQTQWGIKTHFEIQIRPDNIEEKIISPSVRIQLLRIVQEALSNARRHANATKISISLENINGWTKIVLKDNGRGFEPSQVSENHLGIHIMQERAASVGGKVSISSRINKGTKLVIEMPNQDFEINKT